MPGYKLVLGAVLLCLIAAVSATWHFQNRNQPEFALLTDAELAEYAKLPQDKHRNLTINASDGPAIQVAAPQGFSLASPVDFDIQVQPRGGVPVDMSSIKIEYKMGPAWINMTRTIMKYASVKGSRLYARGAELPKGRHALRVSVKDAQQRVTQATVSFTVTQ